MRLSLSSFKMKPWQDNVINMFAKKQDNGKISHQILEMRLWVKKNKPSYIFFGDSKSQRAQKLHYWFNSYSILVELVSGLLRTLALQKLQKLTSDSTRQPETQEVFDFSHLSGNKEGNQTPVEKLFAGGSVAYCACLVQSENSLSSHVC